MADNNDLTENDREHAANTSGLTLEQVALIVGNGRDELTANAVAVAAALGIAPKGQR
ncbi:hypothetical protein [Streptomyces sp. NPDC055186]